MEPIINPWFFYLIGVGAHIQILAGIAAGIFAIIWLIMLISETNFRKSWLIMAVFLGLITVFIPSKETCYQMVAASICTPDNINTVIDGSKSLVDYIVESVSEVEEIEKNVDEKEYSHR